MPGLYFPSMPDAVEKNKSLDIAVVGMGCLFPNAPGLKEFWRLIRCGLDGITEVPATHWSVQDYFDPDPRSPDMTYCRRGGFLNTVAFDPSEFGIPPTALEATDTAQLLGLVVAKAALADAASHRASRADRGAAPADAAAAADGRRVSVILGVTGTQELVIPLGARLGHPIWRRALRQAGIDDITAEEVVRRISDAYVPWQENSFPGLLGNVVAGRIANRLDLHGTNCVVDAACASSLGAIHLAAMELQAGRADAVISGGVDSLNDIFMHMCFSKTPALSPTGDARPFSADADGTVLGEGIGLVVLKRLADAQRDGDRIYAVIKAIGASSDGRQNSIYAPSAEGQADAIRRAYDEAGFGPETVELVEAHGTGTKVGDVVEFAALCDVFGKPAAGQAGWCAIGSVKSQIGHTKSAAGAAGLIKAALALHHKVLPPTCKVSAPNPRLNVADSPFYLNGLARPWIARGAHPRRASVSSFGFGGSNFHVLLEEYVAPASQAAARPDRSCERSHDEPASQPAWDGSVEIAALCGPTGSALVAELDEWLSALSEDATWHDLAVRAAQSRQQFDRSAAHRLVLVLERGDEAGPRPGSMADPSIAAARRALEQAREGLAQASPAPTLAPGAYYGSGDAPGRLAMLFPGQGSQYVSMGRDLACIFDEFRDALSELDDDGRESSARPESASEPAADPAARAAHRLIDLIYPPAAFSDDARVAQLQRLTATDAAQPAIGAVSLGMLRVLRRFGVAADACAGHSFGELTALHAGGRFDLPTFRRLARLRGRVMAACAQRRGPDAARGASAPEPGAMLAVDAPLERIEQMLRDAHLSATLANRNSPNQGVLSGRLADIEAAAAACRQRGLRCRRLNVAAAFHTRFMLPAANAFADGLRRSDFREAATPVYSNVTGMAYPPAAESARDLLCRQMTSPVDFAGQVANLYAFGVRTFVEVGPKAVLTGLVHAALAGRQHVALAMDSSGGSRSGLTDLARLLAQLAALGYAVRLEAWESAPAPRRRPRMVIPLCGANYRAPQPERAQAPRLLPAAREVQPPPPELELVVNTPNRPPDDSATGRTTRTPPGRRPEALPPSAENGRPAPAISVPLLHEALRVVNDGLRAMQALQQQTAEAHQRFLEGQALAHRTFQSMMEGQQRLLERAVGLAPAAELPAAEQRPAAPPPQEAIDAPLACQQPPARRSNGESEERLSPPPTVSARPPARHGPEHAPAPVSRAAPPSRPAWVPPAMAEESPWAAESPSPAGAEFAGVSGRFGAATHDAPASAAPSREMSRGASVATAPVAEVATGEDVETRFSETLLAVVAELTGYPRDMLQLEMDLEADLGIDSIKRVEILAAVQERMPEARTVNPEYMGSLRTLRQIAEYCVGDKKKVS